MTQKIRVADEKLGLLLRREQELNRRVSEGTLDIDLVLSDLQKLIEGKSFNSNTLQIFSDTSLSERINLGRYGCVDDDVTEKNFPEKVEKNYEVKYQIFHFNKSIFSDYVVVEMKKEGFKPASIHELLKLGEIQPNLQREFPIVALGTVCSNTRIGIRVPFLYDDGVRRNLGLGWFDGEWPDHDRFLGVRKVT